MNIFISGACFSGLGYYLMLINKDSYGKTCKFNESLKKNLVFINSKSNLNTIRNGTPVFISEKITCNPIYDPNLKLTFSNAVAVQRLVYMYQVKEKEKNSTPNNKNNSTPYENNSSPPPTQKDELKLLWSEFYQKDRNNPEFPFISETLYTTKISIGPFEFGKGFIQKTFSNTFFENYELTKKICEKIFSSHEKSDFIENRSNNSQAEFLHEFWMKKLKTIENGSLVLFDCIRIDTVGDLKISYRIDASQFATVLGAKYNNTIIPIDENGNSLFYSNSRKISVDDIFRELDQKNYNSYIGTNIVIVLGMTISWGLTAFLLNKEN